MNRFAMTVSMAFFSLVSARSFAFPELNRQLPPSPEFAPYASTYDFKGIVALSNCSGSLVRFDDSADEDQGMILTNGHCVGMLDPGVVMSNQSANRTFDILSATASRLGTVRATRLLYATMTKTDVGLYQLQETYGEILKKYQIQALTLARTQPVVNTDIEVISGYWKRGYGCTIEAITHTLQEGKWLFESSVRYSRPGCEVIGGTSGSPVVEAGTRTVVAVNNTINESGAKCQVNNPCEVNEDGSIYYKKGIGYAQETFWFYSCRNADGQLDLNADGCLLPRPKAFAH